MPKIITWKHLDCVLLPKIITWKHLDCVLLQRVGHGLLIKMAEVTLIDFSYLNRLALLTLTEVGPQFSNQDSRLAPVIKKN